ncbi:MAG: response regulator [Ardenticatenales bacterium]|nr:response regulator [Ardenticatenales bacterium]
MDSEGSPPRTDLILVVDDEPDVRQVLSIGLRKQGFFCETAADATEAIARLAEKEFALMVSDIRMPRVTGLQLLQVVREDYPDLAVIIATASDDRETAVTAMRAGAYDYIVKPFNLEEIHFSIERALEKRRLALEVRAYQQSLERKVQERTWELQQKNEEMQRIILDVIASIAVTLEVRDEYTAHHSYRVADLSVRLAQQFGLQEPELEQVRLAALLHDIGKIGIRESVLHKEGKLTPEERKHIETHPLVAEQILRPLKHLQTIIPAIKHEHEAYDGSGYPDGLSGEIIPLEARIIAVADAYDALTSDRPYRLALPHQEAMEIMYEGAGRIWDPELVPLFERMMEGNQG